MDLRVGSVTEASVPSPRLPVRCLRPFYTSSSWRHSHGCFWKGCSCISCWWRFSRASILVGSTFIWWAMGCLRSSWPCPLQSTTGATGQTKCELWLFVAFLRSLFLGLLKVKVLKSLGVDFPPQHSLREQDKLLRV